MKLEKNIFFLSIGIKFGSVCKIGFVAYEFKSYWFSLSFIYKLKFIENWYNILISSYPDHQGKRRVDGAWMVWCIRL